jgi:hypothetical protein
VKRARPAPDLSVLDDAFFQARLKVDRANRHVQEAEAILKGIPNPDFCKVTLETQGSDGAAVIRVAVGKLPAALPLAIGDVFHNLNAALNYVASGLMRSVGKASARDHFPIDETRKSLRQTFKRSRKNPTDPSKTVGAGKHRKVIEAFPNFALLLLCKIQPYKGGRFGLWEVRKADNIDKHRLIIPTVQSATVYDITWYDPDSDNEFTCSNFTLPIGTDIVLFHAGRSCPNAKFKYNDKPTLDMTFQDGGEVFSSQPVMPTLIQSCQLADQALTIIEQHFNARKGG